MSIIKPQDFQGENKIAQVESLLAVQQAVQLFIDDYEPIFLESLWGFNLYTEFLAGMAETPILPKWQTLNDDPKLKSMLVNYVYFFYSRNITTNSTGSSEVKAKNDNSTPVNGMNKQTKAWNNMQRLSVKYKLDTNIYPSYVIPHFHHLDPIYILSCVPWPLWLRRKVNEIYVPIPAGGLNI